MEETVRGGRCGRAPRIGLVCDGFFNGTSAQICLSAAARGRCAVVGLPAIEGHAAGVPVAVKPLQAEALLQAVGRALAAAAVAESV